jgi:inactive dipeptidyl peptidase 10
VPEGKPGQRHLYRVQDQNVSTTAERQMECLTCPEVISATNITDSDYGPCLFSHAYFSPSRRYYIHECLGPEPPLIWLVDVRANNTRIALIDDYPALRNKVAVLALPQVIHIIYLIFCTLFCHLFYIYLKFQKKMDFFLHEKS